MRTAEKYTKEGHIIMGAAAQHAKIYNGAEIARRSGIPYNTFWKRIHRNFGSLTMDSFRAIARVSGMTDAEIVAVVRCAE